MNRQQRRAAERKNQKYKTATYNLTKSQLDNAVKDSVKSELEKAYQDGELDMDKLKEDLWEYGGVRLEESK